MRALIERHGGIATIAPSMREIPLTNNHTAIAGIERILNESINYFVLLTGVGTEALFEIARQNSIEASLIQRMDGMSLLVRGPKPAAVLTRYGLKYTLRAPEPNTWKELIHAVDAAGMDFSDQAVAVQEYGEPSVELASALTERGAEVVSIPVYRWALPQDTAPLKSAISATIMGDFDILMFTSAQQVRHALAVSESMKQSDSWVSAANHCFVASIGPTCSDAIAAAGIQVGYESDPPKMGSLIRGSIGAFSAQTD